MMRRVVPLALALAMAFAPVALDACQAECARHAAHGSATGVMTHHHHVAEPGAAVHSHHVHHTAVAVVNVAGTERIDGVPHGCAHGDGLPAVGATLQATLAPASVPAIFQAPQPTVRPHSWSDADSPPLSARIAQATQLRI